MDIYIPSWHEAELVAACSLSGSIHWKLINEARSDKPVIAEGAQHNMLMQGAIDKWLGAKGQSDSNQPMSLANVNKYPNYCLLNSLAVGSGNLQPTNSQTALQSEVARVAYGSQFLPPTSQGFYVLGTYIDTVFTIGPDVTGDLKEWGIFANKTAATGMLCRELFRGANGDPITIVKTSQQSLSITYRLQLKRAFDVVQNTINMDGIDYECSTWISDKQLMCLLGIANESNNRRLWRNIISASYANLYVGDSNAPSDLLGDTHNALKGTVLKSAKVTTAPILSTYTDGSNSRTLTMNIAAAECNGDIGEILMPMDAYASSENYFVARSTFNPRIAKVSPQKLAIGFTLSVSI
jgi:hypothetical protein